MKFALECNCGHRCTVTADALPRFRNGCPGCRRPTADAYPQGSIEFHTVVADMRGHTGTAAFQAAPEGAVS
jgi:hypothetical protein